MLRVIHERGKEMQLCYFTSLLSLGWRSRVFFWLSGSDILVVGQLTIAVNQRETLSGFDVGKPQEDLPHTAITNFVWIIDFGEVASHQIECRFAVGRNSSPSNKPRLFSFYHLGKHTPTCRRGSSEWESDLTDLQLCQQDFETSSGKQKKKQRKRQTEGWKEIREEVERKRKCLCWPASSSRHRRFTWMCV